MVIRCRGANRALVSLVPFVRWTARRTIDRRPEQTVAANDARTVSVVELANALRASVLTFIALARQTPFAFPVSRRPFVARLGSRICAESSRIRAERLFGCPERLCLQLRATLARFSHDSTFP